MTEFNEATLMAFIAEQHDRLAANPTRMVVSSYAAAVLRLTRRAFDERWDRRRLKRELRRAETSTYRRVAA